MDLVDFVKTDDVAGLERALASGDRSRLQAVKAQSIHGASLLHHAVEAGALKSTRFLIERRHVEVNVADETGATPLHRAVSEGHINVVKLLLELYGDVDAKDSRGETPLHTASYRGDVPMARLLLERGANIDTQSGIGYTPLHAAAKEGRSDLISLLIMNGAKMNLTDINQQTARALATDEHPSFAAYFDLQAIQAKAESAKKQQELEVLRNANAKLEAEKAELRATVAALEKRANDEQAEKKKLEEANEMIKASLQETLMEPAAFKAKEADAATAAAQQPTDFGPKAKELEEAKSELEDLRKRQAAWDEQKSALEKRVEALASTLEDQKVAASSASNAAAKTQQLHQSEKETLRGEHDKAWATARHAEAEREIVQVVLKNAVEELEKSEAKRKELEGKLKQALTRTTDLEASLAQSAKQPSAVQIQVLDKSPSGVAHQELSASFSQLQEAYKQLKGLISQTEQVAATVNTRIDAVKDKLGKTPTLGGGGSGGSS